MSLEDLKKRLAEEIAKNRALELALIEKNREIEMTQQESEHDLDTKCDFLSRMSHEIRTPLNGIVGMTSLLLQEEDLSDKQKHFLEVIQQSSGALISLVNDILAYSKLEANRFKVEPVSMNLLELIRDLFYEMSQEAERQNLEIFLEYDPTTPHWVVGDPKRIRQIIVNLLSNALKFTDKGYIILSVSRQKEGKKPFIFKVLDTGPGVEESFKEKIFEKFTQASFATNLKHEGSGLGLAICKQIVRVMNGEIGIKDNPGGGSIFWFTLPLKVDESKNVPFKISEKLKRARLLVVDSHEIERKIMKDILGTFQLDFEIFDSEKEALKALDSYVSSRDIPCIVIISHDPPEVDAVRMVKTVQSQKKFEEVAIFVLCRRTKSACEEELQRLGISGVFYKPISSLLMIEELQKMWKEKAKEKAEKKRLHKEFRKGAPKLKVLVVEDDFVNQQVLASMVESLNCQVDLADNGIEAIKKWETIRYDLIFMDIKMPLVDGVEATKIIREHEKGGISTPIVALTAQIDETTRKRCLKAQVDDFVSKPVTVDDLKKVLKKYA